MKKENILDDRKANHNRIDSINDIDTLRAECKLWFDLYLSATNEKNDWEKLASENFAVAQQYKKAFGYVKNFAKKIKECEPKGVR